MDSNLLRQQKNASEYFILDCEKYEDYLEMFVTLMDLRFIRDIRACRKIVEFGYRSAGTYTAEQFQMQKKILREQMKPSYGKSMLYSVVLNSSDPLLIELAAREKPNYQKMISTIIFLTYRNKNGFEISGFIDFEASLSQCNLRVPGHTKWRDVFRGKVKLRPKPDDLSFYNVSKGIVRHNNSDNYIVQHDVKNGITFLHRGDHKKIFADNKGSKTERNYWRSTVFSPRYGYAILFDHVIRKKI